LVSLAHQGRPAGRARSELRVRAEKRVSLEDKGRRANKDPAVRKVQKDHEDSTASLGPRASGEHRGCGEVRGRWVPREIPDCQDRREREELLG